MLMGQVKRMLCLMYGNCPSHRLDNMKEKALKRKVHARQDPGQMEMS